MNSQLDSNLEFLGKVEPDSLAYLSGILFGVVERVGLAAALNGKEVAEKESAIVEVARLRFTA